MIDDATGIGSSDEVTLETLSALICEHYVFDGDAYPALKGDGEDGLVFSVRHITLHLAKACGALAAALERYDHGEVFAANEIRALPAKLLVNALRLAALLDIPPSEVAAFVNAMYQAEP